MKLSWKQFDLHLRHAFRISRGVEIVDPVMIVSFEHDGIAGFGEASPTPRYHETIETVAAFLKRVDLSRFDDPFQTEDILLYVQSLTPVGSPLGENTSAKCAVDIALHDWIGKKLNVPLYKLLGLDKSKTALSSFTIGIDSPDMLIKKIREAEEYPVLKIKLGMENDRETIKTIRSATDKVLRVDANEGWTTKELALERIKWLQDENVEFVEQPMPAAQLDDMKWLRAKITMPLIADENVIGLRDIPKLGDAFDGINIKLMKCTGIREAVRMIHTARAMNMKIMMGCMIETAVAISAAAHLSPLLDYADLDGNVLITDDPFDGVRNVRGKLELNDKPGLGVVLRN
ncbi:MAG: dipeptide epimerase [Bacteroidota bacterium]|nr:dipeptide epimerase [Bacteroidota bacterium]